MGAGKIEVTIKKSSDKKWKVKMEVAPLKIGQNLIKKAGKMSLEAAVYEEKLLMQLKFKKYDQLKGITSKLVSKESSRKQHLKKMMHLNSIAKKVKLYELLSWLLVLCIPEKQMK